MTRARIGLVVAALVCASRAHAQGTLSVQGLGFPPGQLSTASRTMGGSTGEADPISALNPAAIGVLARPILVMQADPEYRTTDINGKSGRTSIARFPLFMAGLPLGDKWTLTGSVSTILDRSWLTSTRDSQVVAGDSVKETRKQRSDGSIADIRVAVARSVLPWLKVGLAAHALSGRDFLETVREFDDTTRFVTDIQQSTVSFGGHAFSGGLQAFWPKKASVGMSYRMGGTMRAYLDNKVVGQGEAPDHLGVSAVYLGFTGSALAVRLAKDTWSNLNGLSRDLHVHEGWDVGVGGDFTGPRMGSGSLSLRVGGRWRTLPFAQTDTSPAIKEQTWSGGFALPMARNSVELNVGVLHSSRKGAAGNDERAWTLSTGFAVRP